MSEPRYDGRRVDRFEKTVERLLRGKRLKVDEQDAEDSEAIRVAAELAAARQPYPRMSAGFRQHLDELLRERRDVRGLTRRHALMGGAAAAATLLVGAGLERVFEEQTAPGTASPVISPEPGKWTDVAALTEIPEGEAFEVKAGAVSGFVFRRGRNVSGVSSTCSHYPCPLWWDHAQGNIACHCHPQRFSRQGQPLGATGYALRPLARLQVRVVDDRVEVFGT